MTTPGMRYGIEIVTLGDYADPQRVVELAVAAEAAGFDLVAVWDHLAFAWGVPSGDPLVTLSAVAQATKRVLLVPAVLALPRYSPHLLAWQLACLDRLSGGRLVLGAGLGGVPSEFAAFGEELSAADRAGRADEMLDVMARLWSGERVDHVGHNYRVKGVTLAPLPMQRPRPPIWVGGASRGALRRAARWDGWIAPGAVDERGRMTRIAAELGAIVDRLRAEGAAVGAGFEVVVDGISRGPGAANPADFAAVGTTWWLEVVSPSFGGPSQMLDLVRAGPPR